MGPAGRLSIQQERKLMERHFLSGSLLEMQEQYVDAITEYRRALRFDFAPGALYYALAKCYHATGRDDSALVYAQRSVARDPENIGARQQLADLLLATGRFYPSAEQYEEIIRRDPDNIQVRDLLARMWHRRDQQRAIVHYEYIRRNLGDDFDALLNLSELYLNQKSYGQAADVLRQLLEMNPDATDLYDILADTYLKEERYEDAIALLAEAGTHIATDSLAEEYFTGQLTTITDRLRAMHDQPPGLRDYAKALAEYAPMRVPGSWKLKYHSGLLRYRLDDMREADSMIAAALKDTLATAEAWTEAATLYLAGDHYTRALRILAPTAYRHDRDAEVFHLLGMAYMQAGRNDSAERALRHALAIDEGNGDVWGVLASLYGRE
jgi:tetratricopeptide (TPR) repeat protein